jgi:serine/threonine protein kinase
MAAPAADLLGASNFWMDPKLLALRIKASKISLGDRLTPLINIEGRHSPTEVYAGLFRGKLVAVKRLTLVGQKTPANAAELATVAKGLHQLQHHNLVSLLGLSWHKAQDLQVVTPLAARGDLRSLLDSRDAPSLTWDDFKCQVALDIISALGYLHREGGFAGMGALTSWNILLDADNRAQLNLLQLPHRDLESARDRVRSPLRWLAPEVILGGPPTHRAADMYAFGVLLTELDTTKLPFHDAVNPNGAAMEDMLVAFHVARRHLRPTVSVSCPKQIAEIVDKCLSHDPMERPSASSVEYELRALLKRGLANDFEDGSNDSDVSDGYQAVESKPDQKWTWTRFWPRF